MHKAVAVHMYRHLSKQDGMVLVVVLVLMSCVMLLAVMGFEQSFLSHKLIQNAYADRLALHFSQTLLIKAERILQSFTVDKADPIANCVAQPRLLPKKTLAYWLYYPNSSWRDPNNSDVTVVHSAHDGLIGAYALECYGFILDDPKAQTRRGRLLFRVTAWASASLAGSRVVLQTIYAVSSFEASRCQLGRLSWRILTDSYE